MINKIQGPIQFCPAMTLEEYVRACKGGKGLPPPSIVQLLGNPNTPQGVKDLLCAISSIGGLEPLAATRPGACDLVYVYDRTVDVPAATIDADGKIVPSDGLLIEICAAMGQVLVVDKLRANAANLTAEESGEIVVKRQAIFGFSEGFCQPGEPGTGSNVGTFLNVEHLILCPDSGFDVYGRNHDPFSNALFHIYAKMWATC